MPKLDVCFPTSKEISMAKRLVDTFFKFGKTVRRYDSFSGETNRKM